MGRGWGQFRGSKRSRWGQIRVAFPGAIRGAQAAVIDYANRAANDFLAVNQVTVTEREHTRRLIGLGVLAADLERAFTGAGWTYQPSA